MDQEFTTLQRMLQARPCLFAKRESFQSLLLDIMPSNRPQVAQLMMAYDCGVFWKLLETPDRSWQMENKLQAAYERTTGYDSQTVKRTIANCMSCVDQTLIQSWEVYQREKQAARERRLDEESEQKVQASSYPPVEFSEVENLDDIPAVDFSELGEETADIPVPEGVFIPCGVGMSDRGFAIQGLRTVKHCSHPLNHVFSLIWNYLQRNSVIDEKTDKPIFLREYGRGTAVLDYGRVYRLMMLTLLLVKNNYLNGNVVAFRLLSSSRNPDDEMDAAIKCVNRYLALFCKFTRETPVELVYQNSGPLKVSLGKADGASVQIVNHKGARQSRRVPWESDPIRYQVGESERRAFVYLLRELSHESYRDFRPGQFEALCGMLNAHGHSVCIMPTGAGKSLIFYICAMLQPGTAFVVTPNRLLIEDQLRNLKETHHFDDVKWLETEEAGSRSLEIQNKLCYLTPETFQNTELLKTFIVLNSLRRIGYIVLDEVHCISNWSHDFRPEYLMLSTYLNRYLDKTRYLCFTATANYSVMKDIQQQLRIEEKGDILSPVDLRKQYHFTFLPCGDERKMVQEAYRVLRENSVKGRKTLVFTKSEDCSLRLSRALSHLLEERSVYEDEFQFQTYHSGDSRAYQDFADGECRVLIADEELGIGINLMDVDAVLHFGLPLSKGEFVQQIGRAGRAGAEAQSVVIYLTCSARNIDAALLARTTRPEDISEILRTAPEQNDYTDTFRRLVGDLGPRQEFLELTQSIFASLKEEETYRILEFQQEESARVKRAFFILFAIGAIDNWSFYAQSRETFSILANVQREARTLQRCKEQARRYLHLLGSTQRAVNAIGLAERIEDVISAYVNWYYDQFVRRHKEEFQDMLSLFERCAALPDNRRKDEEVNQRLAAYFSLSMMEISREEEKYTHSSFKEIAVELVEKGDLRAVETIQRINQNRTHVKLDFYLFVYGLLYEQEYDRSRLMRMFDHCEQSDFFDLSEAASVLYGKLDEDARWRLLEDLNSFGSKYGESFEMLFDVIYRSNPKDLVYYGTAAKRLNICFH